MREITFDTETTGFDPDTGDRIVEIGCVEVVNKIKTGNYFHVYLNPERDMPKSAEKIHGLSSEFLKDKPLFKDIAKDFIDFIGNDKLVIHNAAFDMKFINFELSKHGHALITENRAIDTLAMARLKFPGAKASLDALCQRFGISLDKRTKHGALLDAELLADVYVELCGGRQNIFILGEEKEESSVVSLKNNKKKWRSPREFKISEEEKEAHKAMVSSIKEALWANYP